MKQKDIHACKDGDDDLNVGTRFLASTATAADAAAETDDDNDEVFHPSKRPNGHAPDKSHNMASGCNQRSILRSYYGIWLALVSAFFLALSNTFIKKARFLCGSEQTFVRYVVQLVIMMAIMCRNKLNVLGDADGKQRRLLAYRGIFGTIGLVCIHFSVKMIDPSDAVALIHTNVVIVAVLSRFLLNEKLSIMQIGALTLTCVGVIFISKPRFLLHLLMMTPHSTMASEAAFSRNSSSLSTVTTFAYTNNSLVRSDITSDDQESAAEWFETFRNMLGVTIALVAATASSLVSVLIKKLNNKNVHYSVTIVYAAYFGLPVSAFITIVLYATGVERKDWSLVDTYEKCAHQIAYSLVSALSGTWSQILLNLALKHEEASKVSIMRSTDLFFVFLLQFVFLGILSNLLSTIGALCIFLATMFLIVVKYMEKRYKNVCTSPII